MDETRIKPGPAPDPHYDAFFHKFKGLSARKSLVWRCKPDQSPWQLAAVLRSAASRRKVKVSLRVIAGGIEARKVKP